MRWDTVCTPISCAQLLLKWRLTMYSILYNQSGEGLTGILWTLTRRLALMHGPACFSLFVLLLLSWVFRTLSLIHLGVQICCKNNNNKKGGGGGGGWWGVGIFCVTWCFMPSRPSWLYQGDFCVCKKVLLLIEIKTQTLAKCVDLSTCEFDIVIKLTSPIQTHSPPPSNSLTNLTICTPSRTHSCTPKPLEQHPTLPPHHWLVHLPTHTSTPSLTCTPTHPPHHFLICTPTHPHVHPIALWFAHLPTYTSTLSLTCTPTHPIALTCPPTHPHVHPITDLYTYPPHRSDLPTYPPTCPPYHWLVHLPTPSLWLAHLPTHMSTLSLTCTPTHPIALTCPPTHPHVHPITDLYTYPPHRSDLPTYPPTCPPYHWLAYLPTHTSTPSLTCTPPHPPHRWFAHLPTDRPTMHTNSHQHSMFTAVNFYYFIYIFLSTFIFQWNNRWCCQQ